MASIIVTGATGTSVLTNALASPNIAHVTVLARRAPALKSDKLTTILLPSEEYPDGFDRLPPNLVERLQGNEAVVWALGISQTQVSKDEYYRITHDYTMEAARALSSLGTSVKPFRFVYVSGSGADQQAREDAWFTAIFAKVKGRTERELAAMDSDSFKAVSLRPAAILPTLDVRANWVWPCYAPSLTIESSTLADASLALATGQPTAWETRDPKEYWLDNSQLKRIGEAYRKDMSPN